MYRAFYENMSLTELPLFTLILFLTVFVAVVVRVYSKQRKPELDALAALPLEGRDE